MLSRASSSYHLRVLTLTGRDGYFRVLQLMGRQVVFYPLLQRLGDLLLASSGAVGEEPSFRVARDEYGLGDGRRHVALEEDSGGVRVGGSRADGSRIAGRWQGRELVEQSVGQFLVLAPLAEEGGRVILVGIRGAVHVDGDQDVGPRAIGVYVAVVVGEGCVVGEGVVAGILDAGAVGVAGISATVYMTRGGGFEEGLEPVGNVQVLILLFDPVRAVHSSGVAASVTGIQDHSLPC